MHWFSGNIADAVKQSKERDTVFVVLIEGDDEQSRELCALVDNEEIRNKLSQQSHFLNVKIKSGSTDYTHFAQIYQFVPVPSLFFIGRKGEPLEVICNGVQAEDLSKRIDRIINEHTKDGKASTKLFLKGEDQSNADEAKAPQSAASSKSDDYEMVCDGDVCVRKPKNTSTSEPGTSSQVANKEETPVLEKKSSEDKVEHAKEVVEARRREKELKEKELAKQRELERRATGQGVAELKRWQADQEMKQIQEERKRERIENELARKRILDQIAQDRAERKARESTVPQVPQPTHATPAANPDVFANPIGDTPTARLSFKTPDGSTQTKLFEAASTLADIRIYVADTFKMPASSFTLWINFPRRQLVDDAATVQQLGLTPSAVILILRNNNGNFSPGGSSPGSWFSFISSILTTLVFKPARDIYAWVASFVTPRPPLRSPEPERTDGRPEPRQGLRYRPRTNVHRLADENDDDDNGTWNGNSTQQM